MGSVAPTPCRKVAPLLARWNDPDLTEAERVMLSTHLLGCAECMSRIQEYRAIDGRVRGMAATTLAPRVRDVVMQQVALGALTQGGQTLAQPWRHAWSSLAIVVTLTTLLCAAGVALSFTQRAETQLATGAAVGGVARPMTMTLLNAGPAATIAVADQASAYRRQVGAVQATRPAAVGATIRLINLNAGQIVVSVAGSRSDERIAIMRDTAILLPDGRPGTLADLVIGIEVQLQREATGSGGVVAREIIVAR